MRNTQLPYNQLTGLSEEFKPDFNLLYSELIEANSALSRLKGFMEAIENAGLNSIVTLMERMELRASFELEAQTISLGRFVESVASENYLGDELTQSILECHRKFYKTSNPGIDSLSPDYFKVYKSKQRELKNIAVQSYNTRLTLYTPPSQMLVQELSSNLDSFLRSLNRQSPLQFLTLASYQIRALSPYPRLNGHVSRVLLQNLLHKWGYTNCMLPISQIILGNKEEYQTIMKKVVLEGKYLSWQQLMLKVVTEAAEYQLEQIKAWRNLRQSQALRIEKYTDYLLPLELSDLVCSNCYIKASDIISTLKCHRHSAYKYLAHLTKTGILIEKNSGREKLYLNQDLLTLLSK